VKILLALLGSIGLCSCATFPISSDNSFDEDQYVTPRASFGMGPNYADPRAYMDKDDMNMQKLMSTRMFPYGM
jgi:hypothetical protein